MSCSRQDKSVLVVGISGPTCSGKSLLGEILTKVFDGSAIIHQDSFFQPKSICPTTTFRCTRQEDRTFISQTLATRQTGEYTIIKDVDTYNVTGPDTDCNEAIDFLSMLGMITQVINTGVLPDEIEFPGNPGLILGHDNKRIKHEFDLSHYEGLIKELRGMVAKRVREHLGESIRNNRLGRYIQPPSINSGLPHAHPIGQEEKKEDMAEINTHLPIICFVEGFLLFSPPSQASPRSEVFDLETEQNQIRSHYQTISDLLFELKITDPKDQDPYSIQAKQEIIQEIWDKNLETKEVLQDYFGVKLFLPTSKEKVMERRLRRDGDGEGRETGQMWKTRGYFEGVAWRGFESGHGWLLGKDGKAEQGSGVTEGERECKGIKVRPGGDVGVEETTRWAVEEVLGKLVIDDEVGGISGGVKDRT